jgi:outer membrane protein OmpA-like peptidoglycan-associated protein
MNTIPTKVGLGVALLALLATGCASTHVPSELADARTAYNRAAQSPNAGLVPGDMGNARESLARAERQFHDSGDAQSTRDLAYVAQRNAISAEAKAGAVRASLDKQMALADLESTRRQQQAKMASELARSKERLTQAEQMAQSERQARIAADQRTQELVAKFNDVRTQSFPRGLILTISGGVLFASGKNTLLPSAQTRLKAVAEALKEDQRSILIVGHTDDRGADQMNLRLSGERADAVMKFLVQQGVPESRMRTQGMGEAQPIASNRTPEGRANNRRVEIIMENEPNTIPYGGAPGGPASTGGPQTAPRSGATPGMNMPNQPPSGGYNPPSPQTPMSPQRIPPPSTTPAPMTPPPMTTPPMMPPASTPPSTTPRY